MVQRGHSGVWSTLSSLRGRKPQNTIRCKFSYLWACHAAFAHIWRKSRRMLPTAILAEGTPFSLLIV